MVIWVAVGILLIWRGLPYTGLRENADIVGLAGNERWIALGCGVILGIGKGMSALKKGARRAVRQIVDKGESAPPWTIFSPFMFVLVGLMVAAGLALRYGPYDDTIKAWVVGILYPGIGVALIIGGLLALSVQPAEPKR
ncbi:MAG: hypothetical protein DRQ55_13260 [Planctomycetota bacterium]|nr:MAG: hypothetical protein DRQ55_13260 [Planctomycetota bacterium]